MKTWLVVIFSFLSFCDNEFVFVLSSKNDGCKRTEILDFKAEFEVMKGNSHTLLKRSSCLSHHVDLVKVENVDEETFLKTTARALGTHFWFAARDDVTEGRWVWSADDSDLDYTDWYPAQPNNYLVEEDCLELSGGHNWILRRMAVE